MAYHLARRPAEAIASARVAPRRRGLLIVTSDAVDVDGWLSEAHARHGGDFSPSLVWSGPPDVISYVLIVEDPHAPADEPTLHWLVWNIPGDLNALPAGLDRTARPEGAGGATQGLNSEGEHGWLGLHPPPGHGPHRYHFQLFGLDRRLDLRPDAPLDDVLESMREAILVKGEMVGRFETLARDGRARALSGRRAFDDQRHERFTDRSGRSGRGTEVPNQFGLF